MYPQKQLPAAWCRILPYAIYLGFLALEQLTAALGSEQWPGFDLRWLYPAKVVTVLIALLWLWPRYQELRSSLKWLEVMQATTAGIGVWVLWIALDQEWASLGESSGFDPRGPDGHVLPPLAAFRVFGAAIVVPVMEELFWRSFIMRWLVRQEFLTVEAASVRLSAFLITAVLFGMQHHLWVAGIVAGLIYGGLYVRTGNLWISILAHAVTNGALGVWVLANGQWRLW